jgi:PAS domain S-box-containing protein
MTHNKKEVKRLVEGDCEEVLSVFELLIENAPFSVTGWDRNFAITLWNESSEKLFGWRNEEVIGKNLFELQIPEEDRDTVYTKIKEMMVSGKPFENVNRDLTKDGRVLTVQWFNIPLKNTEGAVVGGLSIGIDQTEKIKTEIELRESEEKFRSIYEYTTSLVAILDEKGIFMDSNPSMNKSLGFSPLNKSLFEVYPEEIARMKQDFLEKVIEEEELQIFEDTVDDRIYINTYIPFRVGGKKACLIIATNRTEIVQLNRLLRAIIKINQLIIHERDKFLLLKKACDELAKLQGYRVWIALRKNSDFMEAGKSHEVPTCIKRDFECVRMVFEKGEILGGVEDCPYIQSEEKCYIFPMKFKKEIIGAGVIHSSRIISHQEQESLQTMFCDLAFAIEAIELERQKKIAYKQIEKNIELFAILVDAIRNPISVISGITELELGDRGDISEILLGEVKKIQFVIERLDRGWLESEDIRKFLDRHRHSDADW